MSKPAVIITHTRSGGTFLSHCLSNHPQIAGERGEPLHWENMWQYEIPGIIDRVILKLTLEKQGYAVGLCKLCYAQVSADAWQYLTQNGAAIIHLVRENVLRAVVSYYATELSRTTEKYASYPVHTYQSCVPPRFAMLASLVLERCAELRTEQRAWATRLLGSGLPVMAITYAEMVGGEGHEAVAIPPDLTTRLCDFLGVERRGLSAATRRVNPAPLSAILTNWSEVQAQIASSEFAYCLKGEELWHKN